MWRKEALGGRRAASDLPSLSNDSLGDTAASRPVCESFVLRNLKCSLGLYNSGQHHVHDLTALLISQFKNMFEDIDTMVAWLQKSNTIHSFLFHWIVQKQPNISHLFNFSHEYLGLQLCYVKQTWSKIPNAKHTAHPFSAHPRDLTCGLHHHHRPHHHHHNHQTRATSFPVKMELKSQLWSTSLLIVQGKWE